MRTANTGMAPARPALPMATADKANRDMRNAIRFANEKDFLHLLESALQQGADLNAIDANGKCVLHTAVEQGEPGKLRTLLAKGAQMPAVPEGDSDLLMEAAANGAVDMIVTLVDIARHDLSSTDRYGQTALHHAARSGNTASVAALLARGAMADAGTTGLTNEVMSEIFGLDHGLDGSNVTPLMIATALGNDSMVSALLLHDADLNSGARHPLVVALRIEEEACLQLLLETGADPLLSKDVDGRSALEVALDRQSDIACLRLLVMHMQNARTNCKQDSPLGLAVASGQHQAAALLLAAGNLPEPASDVTETIWDLASMEQDNGKMCDILAAAYSPKFESADKIAGHKVLATLNFGDNAESSLSSRGLFPALFDSVLPVLPSLTELSDAQTSLEVAFLLARSNELRAQAGKPELPLASGVVSGVVPGLVPGLAPDEKWLAEIDCKKTRQAKAVLQASDTLLANSMVALAHALSFEFFLTCSMDCPDDVALSEHISNRLTDQMGLPQYFATAIGKAWRQAANRAQQWYPAPEALEDANIVATRMAASLIEIALDAFDPPADTLVAQCKQLLRDKLAADARPLTVFCASPVQYLRKLEGRTNLEAVHAEALTPLLQRELALTPALCRKLAEGWAGTVGHTRRNRSWRTPAGMQQVLSAAFAARLGPIIAPGPGNVAGPDFALPDAQRNALLDWCSLASTAGGLQQPQQLQQPLQPQQAQPDPRQVAVGNRRPAEAEAPGAPDNKRQRTEYQQQ